MTPSWYFWEACRMGTVALCRHHQQLNWFFHTWALQEHMVNMETSNRAHKYSTQLIQPPWTPQGTGSRSTFRNICRLTPGRLQVGTPTLSAINMHRERVHQIPYPIPTTGTLYLTSGSPTGTFWGGQGLQSPFCLPTLPIDAQEKGEIWAAQGEERRIFLKPLLFSVLIITAHPLSITFSFCTNN